MHPAVYYYSSQLFIALSQLFELGYINPISPFHIVPIPWFFMLCYRFWYSSLQLTLMRTILDFVTRRIKSVHIAKKVVCPWLTRVRHWHSATNVFGYLSKHIKHLGDRRHTKRITSMKKITCNLIIKQKEHSFMPINLSPLNF